MTKPKGPTSEQRKMRYGELKHRVEVLFDMITEAQMELKVLERGMYERGEIDG